MSSEVTVFDPRVPITKSDLDQALERRKLLKEFINSQMREDVDFGIIPGTNQQSLLKPGAEKLSQLFGVATRIVERDKEVDLHQNFAMFTYTIEAYHIRTGQVIAQCEGSCNSHEKKYKTRTVKGAKEETQVGDILNTLMKMAQKRAYVGTIIQATGASDFYTQDIEDAEDAEQVGIAREAKRATASIPGVKSAKSTGDGGAPICCGKQMMASKFHKDTWYCFTCKATQPMEAAEAK